MILEAAFRTFSLQCGLNGWQKGVPAVPELPPDVDEDDLDVSDEDLEFVQKHQQYAGFMANLDTATINK